LCEIFPKHDRADLFALPSRPWSTWKPPTTVDLRAPSPRSRRLLPLG